MWTTHLMAPEACTLNAAIDGWILGETGNEIMEEQRKRITNTKNVGSKWQEPIYEWILKLDNPSHFWIKIAGLKLEETQRFPFLKSFCHADNLFYSFV